ncbi:MAG: autotransporter domain-containing protein [Bradyrhizobium sp.]
MNGGNVQVFGTPTPNLTYTILTAQGGVSGTFTSVAAPVSMFESFALDYTPDSVLLSLRQTQAFASAAATPNQASVAAALAALPASSPLFQAVLAQSSTAGARQAFDALSGEIHASTQTVMLDDSRYFRQAMLGRLRQADFDGATGPMASLGLGGPLQYAEPAADFAARFDRRRGDVLCRTTPQRIPAESAVDRPRACARNGVVDASRRRMGPDRWQRQCGRVSAAVLVASQQASIAVLTATGAPEIAGGYDNSMVSDSARASSANIDTAQFGAYAGAHYGPWNFRAGAAVSWSTVGTDRSILFPGFGDIASAHYGAATAQLFDEVGYGVALGAIAAEPFAGLAWVHLRTDGFNETANTIAALSGSSRQDDVGYSTLGTRVATSTILPNGMALTARASAAWQHAFGDVTPNCPARLPGTSHAILRRRRAPRARRGAG